MAYLLSLDNHDYNIMKKIEAIIRASRFDEVKEALGKKDIKFFTFYEVKGFGHQAAKNRSYRGSVYDVGYIARLKLEIIISEPFVPSALEALAEAAHTGEKGDGLITVSSMEQIFNIRTGLQGSEAINK